MGCCGLLQAAVRKLESALGQAATHLLGGRFPERAIEMAVKRMLPKESTLARKQFSKLRVYAGAEHPHEAQAPEAIDFASMNTKNTKVA